MTQRQWARAMLIKCHSLISHQLIIVHDIHASYLATTASDILLASRSKVISFLTSKPLAAALNRSDSLPTPSPRSSSVIGPYLWSANSIFALWRVRVNLNSSSKKLLGLNLKIIWLRMIKRSEARTPSYKNISKNAES